MILNSKGGKIFLGDPTIYRVLEGELGNLREALVTFVLKEKGTLWAERDDRKADLVFNGKRLEIGGMGKKAKESDYVIKDDLDITIRNVIPLWTLGLMW